LTSKSCADRIFLSAHDMEEAYKDATDNTLPSS